MTGLEFKHIIVGLELSAYVCALLCWLFCQHCTKRCHDKSSAALKMTYVLLKMTLSNSPSSKNPVMPVWIQRSYLIFLEVILAQDSSLSFRLQLQTRSIRGFSTGTSLKESMLQAHQQQQDNKTVEAPKNYSFIQTVQKVSQIFSSSQH